MQKLINGDCLEEMSRLIAEGVKVDLIITSPPYNKKGLLGQKVNGNQIWSKHEINYSEYGDNLSEDLYKKWIVDFLNKCYDILSDNGSVMFNHKPRRHKNKCLLPFEFIQYSKLDLYQLIIWDRKNSPNIRNDILIPCTEHIYWLCKSKPKSFRDSVDKEFISEVWQIKAGRQKNHPAPFPEQLAKNCINLCTKEGDLILDPFMGSGTSGKVAKNLNRNFIGIELDKSYFEIAKERIEDAEKN